MKCDSIKLISSVPFPYYLDAYKYPPKVLKEYVRRFRKKLDADNVMWFLSYKDNNYNINTKMKYLLEIYKLPTDHIFNLNISPDQIISLRKESYLANTKFIELIHQISGDDEIFCGEDISRNSNLFDSRSFKIFQTLY